MTETAWYLGLSIPDWHCRIGKVRIKPTWLIGVADDWVTVEGPAW